jgi:hypothetical protein
MHRIKEKLSLKMGKLNYLDLVLNRGACFYSGSHPTGAMGLLLL